MVYRPSRPPPRPALPPAPKRPNSRLLVLQITPPYLQSDPSYRFPTSIYRNKMDSHQPAQPANPSALLPTRTSLLEHSAFPLLNRRLHEAGRARSQQKSVKARLSDKLLKQENLRLFAKLVEISQRRPKPNHGNPPVSIRKRPNPERERTISLENQRLGRSLVMIKTGQRVERVKTEMTRSAVRSSRKSKRETEPSEGSKHNLFLEGCVERKQSGGSAAQGRKERCINIDLLLELRSRER